MTPFYIQYLLKVSGSSLAEIGREQGCTRAFVWQIAFGLKRTRRIQLAIARKIRQPVDEVFPPKDARRAA